MIALIRALTVVILAAALLSAAPAGAQDPPANDLLNAVLWMQRSVEYKASALSAFALARLRLDQALADPNWTAAPKEQTGNYQSLPPAVILDIDETIVDNSGYQAWMALKDTTFDPKTWNAYVNTVSSLAIPGAVEFAKYAERKGVKVFYISNRTVEEEEATRKNMAKLGFPLDDKIDTVLTTRERPDWTLLQAARDKGKLAIGVDSNQNYVHPGTILTSMVKRVDLAVYETFKTAKDGGWKPGLRNLGVAEGGVGYALDQYNRGLITPEMERRLAQARADIIAGKIKVTDYMAKQ